MKASDIKTRLFKQSDIQITLLIKDKIQTDLQNVSPKLLLQKTSSANYNFSVAEILAYLFSRSELKSVNTGEQSTISKNTIENCKSCDDLPNGIMCTKHKHLETLRILRSPDKKEKQHSRAIASFPPEVELCMSSVPGKGYGVRTVRVIPEGTWIGPYEGKQVKPEELSPETDTSYMWEIFQDGKLTYFLDGSDDNHSSWMRYIRCARYKAEQNTSVMQYFGNIYYRVFKDIPPGQEILVWYDDTCPHYLGIPLKMQDIGSTTTLRESAVTKPQTAPVPTRVPINSLNTGIPKLPSVTHRPIMTSFVPYRGYTHHSLPPVVRAPPPLPRYQVAYPLVSRDTLLHSSFANSSNYNLRELNDAYTAAAIYGNGSSYHAGRKTKSPSAVITHNNIHNLLVSHDVLPYSRDPPMIQSKANGILDQSNTSPELSPNQSKSNAGSRDVPNTGSDPLKGNLDANGNIQNKTTGNQETFSEKIKEKQLGLTSSDSTINKFLSQIEEARIEEMKEKQKSLKEIMNETNVNQDPEDPLELSIWKCGQCAKSFAQQQILQLHICPCIPEKPYKCTYCREAFAQPSDLRTHAVIHSGKKPFKCGFCSRLFAGSTTLNNHIRTHTGEKPFGCEKCGKDFSQASHLSRHRRTLFECK